MVIVVITAQSSQPQWDFILCNFKPDVIYVHGNPALIASSILSKASACGGPEDLPLDHEIVLLAPSNGTYIQGDISLVDLVHPTNVIYWFGSDATHIQADVFANRAPDYKVFIPTDTIDQMYAPASWAVVAWDRRCKGA